MKATAVIERTREAYEGAFQAARLLEYPEVDAFEQRMGYAIERQRLEDAARVLACPLKTSPPHWQHGRVIYAATCDYLERSAFGRDASLGPFDMLDIGTAKGFSALCMKWAAREVISLVNIYSVDVIDPEDAVSRNTVAEVDGLLTLADTVRPWPEAFQICFNRSTGIDWLSSHEGRVHVAFIDGKHDGHVVRKEGTLLAALQTSGDLAIFDDCQIPAVSQAVVSLQEFYKFEFVKAEPREYAIGRRR